jgi:hypothetical protein
MLFLLVIISLLPVGLARKRSKPRQAVRGGRGVGVEQESAAVTKITTALIFVYNGPAKFAGPAQTH